MTGRYDFYRSTLAVVRTKTEVIGGLGVVLVERRICKESGSLLRQSVSPLDQNRKCKSFCTVTRRGLGWSLLLNGSSIWIGHSSGRLCILDRGYYRIHLEFGDAFITGDSFIAW